MRPEKDVFGASIKKAYALESAKAQAASKKETAALEMAQEKIPEEDRPAPRTRAFVKFRIP